MRLKILGCHGGESSTHRTSCFLVDDCIALDAGALTRGLTVAQQGLVDHIILSHAHLDHIRDLGLLADNVIGGRKTPVRVHCTDFTADVLRKHYFNNLVWPDFTKITNPSDPKRGPVVALHRVVANTPFKVGEYKVRTVPVNHTIDCQATFLTGASGTLVYSGDTGPTEALWEAVNSRTDLRALIHELSFPNGMEKLAELSGHLTPNMLARELQKYRPQTKAPVLIYHLKPAFHATLEAEVKALNDARLHILKPMDEFTF